mmetsp:Transcript_37738/g.64280  ORF Transcript_37738/g.64280 Transcript_37738/m.64280 type:complete len:96 (-) Transcript_37738:5-292(-)
MCSALRLIAVITTARTVISTQKFSGICSYFGHNKVPHFAHDNVIHVTVVIVTAHTVMTMQRFCSTYIISGTATCLIQSTTICSALPSSSLLCTQS